MCLIKHFPEGGCHCTVSDKNRYTCGINAFLNIPKVFLKVCFISIPQLTCLFLHSWSISPPCRKWCARAVIFLLALSGPRCRPTDQQVTEQTTGPRERLIIRLTCQDGNQGANCKSDLIWITKTWQGTKDCPSRSKTFAKANGENSRARCSITVDAIVPGAYTRSLSNLLSIWVELKHKAFRVTSFHLAWLFHDLWPLP